MVLPWIDVSVTLRTGMVSWPGDPPARISHALDMERGDPCHPDIAGGLPKDN